MDVNVQREMIEALQNPNCYPHPVSSIRLIETHISFVLLTGAFAYKIKKAVNLGFVDYTQLERRHFFCEEELRLNRRLAPELYLGMVPIVGSPASPRVGQEGEAIEYAVKMVEFNQQNLLDQVLLRNELTGTQLDTLATTLAEFHTTAPRSAATDHFGSPGLVWAEMETLLRHLQVPISATGDRISSLPVWSRSEFLRLEQAFAQRRAAGWVRECHGDLHLGNIVLCNGEPLVFDCIEFNPELRWIDVISDLAFLLMDLAVHGRENFARRLLNRWLEGTGDYAGLALLRFYLVYRAQVRARVAGIRAADVTLAKTAQCAAQASQSAYLDYAGKLLFPRSRVLIVTHGLAGSGKTTLARALSENLGAVCLRSDVERKRLYGLPVQARSGSAINAGLYSEEATRATYEHLKTLAMQVLDAGYPVIVDAATLCRWQRRLFSDLARQAGVPWLILDCRAPQTLLLQRLDLRARQGSDASEANRDVLMRQCRDVEPLDAEELEHAVVIETDRDTVDCVLAKILQRQAL